MKYTFLEFTTITSGYYFTLSGKVVHKYQLYWNEISPYDLLGEVKYKKIARVN